MLCAASMQAVDKDAIIVQPLSTQADTLIRIESADVHGMPVPIYSFKQPSRLSHHELPFKVLPVTRVPGVEHVVALRVPEENARDSWFVGYRWDVLVSLECDKPVHVGWKYSSISEDSSDVFYALIVKTNDDDPLSAASSFAEAIRAKINVGVPAAPWMLALLASQVPVKISL